MKEGEATHWSYFNEYSNGGKYKYNQTTLVEASQTTGSYQLQRQVKQSGYNLKNLPIIYNTDSRSATPTKQTGSSRIVYEQRNRVQIQSPVIKYQVKSQTQPLPELSKQTVPRQYRVDTHEKIITSPYILNTINGSNMNSYVPTQDRRQNLEKTDQSRSRLQIENNATSSQPYPNTKTVIMHQPISEIGFINHRITSANVPSASIPPTRMPISTAVHPEGREIINQGVMFPVQNAPNDSIRNITFMPHDLSARNRQLNNAGMNLGTGNSLHRSISPGMSHLSLQTVPKVQFDKCVNQCKNWETKYNQLYLKYMNLATTASETSMGELEHLRQENGHLRQELRQKEDQRIEWMGLVEQKFAKMVNEQKQATIRECLLLMERFRLESRQSKF